MNHKEVHMKDKKVQMSNEEMMQRSGMGKLFAKMCIPSIVIMLVIVVYNMADIFFIGKTKSMSQVAAVSLAGPVFSVFQGIGTLLGGGGSIAVSIALGKKAEERVGKITSFCCYSTLLLGAAAAVIVNLLVNPIAALLGAKGSVLTYAALYIRILALGAPFILFANVFANIVRADGSAKESMIANGIGTVINVILDPILILGLHMGVAGAAVATVVGNMSSCGFLLWHMLKKQKKFSLNVKNFTVKVGIFIEVISLGIPLAVSTVLMSFSGMFANKLLIGYGDIVIAANGVASKTGMLLSMIAMGICMGVQPAVSYCYGAGNLDRMKKILKTAAILTVSVGTVLTLICFGFRNQIITLFIDDAALIEYGRRMIVGCLVTGPIYGLYQLSTSFLQATGKVSYATFVSVLRQGLVYLPVIFLMNYLFGLNGMIFAAATADIISTVIAVLLGLRWFGEINRKSASHFVGLPTYTS